MQAPCNPNGHGTGHVHGTTLTDSGKGLSPALHSGSLSAHDALRQLQGAGAESVFGTSTGIPDIIQKLLAIQPRTPRVGLLLSKLIATAQVLQNGPVNKQLDAKTRAKWTWNEKKCPAMKSHHDYPRWIRDM